MSSSVSASGPAVTVTLCGVFQLPVVKLSEAALKVTSGLSLVNETVTSALGCVASRTVKESVEPSEIVSALADTIRPGVVTGVATYVSVTATDTVALATLS